MPFTSIAGFTEMTGHIFSDTVVVPEQPNVSVARITKETPAPFEVVGVPLNRPVDASKLRPLGSVPLLMLNVRGAVPPLAVNICE